MNRQLGIKDDLGVVIPMLVMDLVMGRVSPKNFVSELSHRLDLSHSSARIVAQEIEDKMLRPIENDLRTELGIDIGLLRFPAEESPKSLTTSGPLTLGKGEEIPEKIIPPFIKGVPEGRRILEPAPTSGPLILHAEKEEARPPTIPPRPTFSIRIPLNQKYVPAG